MEISKTMDNLVTHTCANIEPLVNSLNKEVEYYTELIIFECLLWNIEIGKNNISDYKL